MDRWEGRVAVVTGASEGIGAAVVRRLAASGMKVVALARRQALLEELQKDVNAKHPGLCHIHVCDVSDELQVKEAFDWIQNHVGAISVLVNNAAVFKFLPLLEMDLADLKATVNTNILGVLYCTKYGFASMKSAGITEGHIININSLCGHTDLGMTGVSVYSATKHALTVLTASLKRELAEANIKIRVSSISPGLVDTTMSAWYTKHNPQTPALSPEDVVEAIVFALASPINVNISELIIQPA